jgi:hypothetical protein
VQRICGRDHQASLIAAAASKPAQSPAAMPGFVFMETFSDLSRRS